MRCLGEEATLEIPHVGLGQVLVLANKDDSRHPKLFCLVLLQSLTNNFRLADVGARRVRNRIVANEDIDSCVVEFVTS